MTDEIRHTYTFITDTNVVMLRSHYEQLVKERDEARAKAAAYERDWYEAKGEFGTAAAKLREKVRALETALTTETRVALDYQNQRDEARRDLGEILAVIHRDGGHYTGEHGISKSVADAHTTWAAVVRERDEALQKERERCARICDSEFAANWHASAMAAANAAKRCAELIRASDEEPHACEPKDSAKHENQ